MTINALLLEETLTELCTVPGLAELVRGYVDRVRPGMLDQAVAAVNEVRAMFAEQGGVGVVPPGWVQLGTLSALADFLGRRGRTCLHLDPERHEPLYAAAWKPSLMVCGDCRHLLTGGLSDEAELTCDGCGRVCVGPPDDGIWPTKVGFGPLTYAFGVCGDCLTGLRVNETAPGAPR